MSPHILLEGTPAEYKVAKLTHLSVFSAIFTVFFFFLSLLSSVSASLAAFLSCCGYCSEYLDLQSEGMYDGDVLRVPNIHLTSSRSR